MSKGQDSQDRFRVLIIRVGSEVGGEGGGCTQVIPGPKEEKQRGIFSTCRRFHSSSHRAEQRFVNQTLNTHPQ